MAFNLLQTSVTEALRAWKTQNQAGLPAAEALQLAAGVCKNQHYRQAFLKAANRAQKGATIESVLEPLKWILSEAERVLIISGWNGGRLDAVLGAIIKHREVLQKAQSRFRSGLLLPMAIIVLGAFIAPFPKFFLGGTVFEYLLSVICPLGIFFGLLFLGKIYFTWRHRAQVLRPKGAGPAPPGILDHLVLALPLIHSMEEKRNLARFSILLSNLLEAGISMFRSLNHCARSLPNGLYRQAVAKLAEEVQEGSSFAQAFSKEKTWPYEFSAAMAVGEKSGTMSEVLNKLGQTYAKQYAQMIEEVSVWLPRLIYFAVMGYLVTQIFGLSGAITHK